MNTGGKGFPESEASEICRGFLWSAHVSADQLRHVRNPLEVEKIHIKELKGTILKAHVGPGRVHVPNSQNGNLLITGTSGTVLRRAFPL